MGQLTSFVSNSRQWWPKVSYAKWKTLKGDLSVHSVKILISALDFKVTENVKLPD
jgi:hypothetical protein